MKLMTEAIKAKLPPLYANKNVKDPTVIFKLFTPWTNWTWLITEGEYNTTDYDTPGWLLYGLTIGQESEMGYVWLPELEAIRGPFGLKIERDRHFEPAPLSEARKRYERQSA